jgi:nuclear pore complex protein Nup62
MLDETSNILRNKTIEQIINQWNEDLNEQLVLFHQQARDISAWDKTVTENGERIAQTYEELLQLESTQKEIAQSLEYVDSQQQELDRLLDTLEQQINAFLDRSPQPQLADEERAKA